MFENIPYVQENVPELLLQPSRLAYCVNLHVGGPRDHFEHTLLLSRNLKFYEYRRKDLVHYIDLQNTRLQKVASQIEAYDGPISPYLDTEDSETLEEPKEMRITFGRYVWQREGIYLLILCWKQLVVLRRPKDHGANFELVAQHEDVLHFDMIEGPIPYQAVVELEFGDGTRQCHDFQETPLDEEPSTSKIECLALEDFEGLLQEVNNAQAELSSQKMKTQKDLDALLDLQVFGTPGQRSLLLEEKVPLQRLGGLWTRICDDYLVCGVLLVNATGSHRMSIVKELYPLVLLEPHNNFGMEHSLYELPLQPNGQPPEDYDQLAQFWACQDQHSRGLDWRPVGKARQLPPECSAVMVVRLRVVDLLQADELHLIAVYEIAESVDNQASSRQLHLATLDVKKLLEKPELLAPTFSPGTLHQDFLTVIMTQTARCSLKVKFQTAEDCTSFEELLVSKLQFESMEAQEEKDDLNSDPDPDMLEYTSPNTIFQSSESSADPVQRIFYNRQSMSQWCGALILRDDPRKHWHVYARTEDRLRLLLHRLKQDLLVLNCNVTELEEYEFSHSLDDLTLELEASLNEELKVWKELQQEATSQEQRREQWTRLHQHQYTSDVLACKLNFLDTEESDTK